jgi:glyoxylase-like metal-dependent hydrolase (beta-lactamase superfamily II)
MTDPELSAGKSRKVGGIRIHAIDAGQIRLDGGAMFGIVPKPLWEKRIPADSRNRIPLAMTCLLIEAPDALVLIDTGVGSKESDKSRDIYGVDNEGDPSRLEDGIRQAGFQPEDIDLVVLTHLHFDHAGGATVLGPGDVIAPAFPRAKHIVQKGELEFSGRDNERIRASYVQRNIGPLTEAGVWDLPDGDTLLTRGVRLLRTPGHTPNHQSVLVESDGATACYLADACPTRAHIPLPWIMGLDLEPLVSLETKRGLWKRAREEDWLLIFEHDADFVWGFLEEDLKTVRPAD